MKKIIISSLIAAAVIGIGQVSAETGSNASYNSADKVYVQDTTPRRKKDSSWNKKKYPDTTHMPKRDSAKGRH